MLWLIIARMLADFALPPGVLPAARSVGVSSPEVPMPISRAEWTPAALATLAAALRRGRGGLRALPDAALLDAWSATVEAFLDPDAPERRALAPPLATLCCLSPPALDAGLEAVLGGVRRRPAVALLERAAALGMAHWAGEPVLVVLASNLPARAGPPLLPALAGVQQLPLEAELRGLPRASLPPAAGTVLLEPEPELRPSPGLRTVRVHPLPDLDCLPEILAPWQGRLQGAALAGPAAWRVAARLAALGISRCTAPGNLQSPDAAWHNGGIDPLAALTLAGE